MTEILEHTELARFPFAAGPLGTPPLEYEELRRGCPFSRVQLPSGDQAVLLVRYDDIAQGHADTRLSHNLTAPGSPRVTAGPSFLDDPQSLLNMDGEDHLRIRRIVAAAFTPRRTETWKPAIRELAAGLLDAMQGKGPTLDLIAEYCYLLPIAVISRMLGVPEQDAPKFREWSGAFFSGTNVSPQEQQRQIGEFTGYVMALIAQRRAEPGADLIDDLIAARDGEDRLSEIELVYLTTLLIAAGNESVSNALSRAVLSLLENDRALWRQLQERPELVPAAVDELLRFNPLGNSAELRLAIEDVQMPSGLVRKGEAVLLATYSALRDERAYPDPDTIVFDRAHVPAQQQVFGGGPHYCLGAPLAKAELQIGLSMLIEHFPELRLAADPRELRFSEGEVVNCLVALPVAL